MDKRNVLLRIKLCPGIGLKGENIIYDWISNHPNSDNLSLEEIQNCIVECLKANHLKYQRFIDNFKSSKLDEEVKINKTENWICILDDHYPTQLKEMYLPPIVLFFRGNIDLFFSPAMLGIVGSRKCSQYSITAMKKIVTKTITNRYVIVSGLAAGVDTLGHQIALANNGKTIAVLGTGLNKNYPSSNKWLQRELENDNLIISEYGLNDGPQKHHFVERNRIIAGLSHKLLVVEARMKSGSLITASLALQNDRDVLAIPGSIISGYSAGTNALIAAGAQACLDDKDLLGRIVI
ncbi:DNA-processing protein DprA [Fructilactobacillus vespulae]|uniref:DNA-processing protein DprA n=1 Tax=Fructilactobacillus vespulae TaxID=1249630 RepID=UPI0039B48FE7